MNDLDQSTDQHLHVLEEVINRADKAGATSADAVLLGSAALEVSWRLGKPEDVERSESRDLGLRVFVDQGQAIVSSTDLSPENIEVLAARAVAMARVAPKDEYAGLADHNRLCGEVFDLEISDPTEPDPKHLYQIACECEEAALSLKGISNSDGAGASWNRNSVAMMTSHGFSGGYTATNHSFYASVVAGEGTSMERDFEFSSARHSSDLGDPKVVGRKAAQRALDRLGPKKVQSGRVPVVFEPRVSRSLLGHLANAISGHVVARGTSFLKDSLGEKLFPRGVEIVDDPHMQRGAASKPFDGEGVANRTLTVISDGELRSWLLDSASARQLSLETTGHAARGVSGPPVPSHTNLYLKAGSCSFKELINDIQTGFYVTELIGFGVNGVTGDYSRGASGYWIEGGEITYPVSELTVAGNLKDMYRQMRPADDLEFRYGTNAPTVRIDGMTVAGT